MLRGGLDVEFAGQMRQDVLTQADTASAVSRLWKPFGGTSRFQPGGIGSPVCVDLVQDARLPTGGGAGGQARGVPVRVRVSPVRRAFRRR